MFPRQEIQYNINYNFYMFTELIFFMYASEIYSINIIFFLIFGYITVFEEIYHT